MVLVPRLKANKQTNCVWDSRDLDFFWMLKYNFQEKCQNMNYTDPKRL